MLLGSGGGRFVRLWRCCLLSVPLGEQASGRRWDCSGLGHVARRCFGTKWYGDVPGARTAVLLGFLNLTTAMRTTAVLLGFLNLTTAMRTTAVLLGFLNLTPAMRTTAVLLGFLNLTTAMRTTAVLLGFLNLTTAMRTTAVLLGF